MFMWCVAVAMTLKWLCSYSKDTMKRSLERSRYKRVEFVLETF